jgi:hypothetical protein
MTYSNTVESTQGSSNSGGAAVLRDGSTYYDIASSRVEQAQRIDVTEQIRQYHELYGGSDNTQASGLSSSKSLNYAPAPTLQRAQGVSTTVYPFSFKLAGSVGLMGAENYYVRVDVNLLTPLNAEFEEDGWESAVINYGPATTINTYESEAINFTKDPPPPDPVEEGTCATYMDPKKPGSFIFNCYFSATVTNPVPKFWDPLVSVDLTNIGVGNIYIDNWVDTMLYTRDKKMWAYDKMYIRPHDYFYIGVHARNTRQLPYNIEVTIGTEFKESADFIVNKDLIAY